MLRPTVVAVVALCVLGLGQIAVQRIAHRDSVPSFEAQICDLQPDWLELIRRGYFGSRVGDISILPRTPAYMAGGGAGWSHSGPWDYLQHVPLVFYGPGRIPAVGEVSDPATTADIAPTIAALLKGTVQGDGDVLPEVASVGGRLLRRPSPRAIVTVVLDGAGWNVLEKWPDAWPTLARLMTDGVSYTDATVGSSPSVTPAVHTTLGTGYYPATHGISSVEMRAETGGVVDAFFDGESSRFIQVPTIAERWDEQTGNRALVGMIGHVPWHLGMIGKGAEEPGGDRDHAAWLDLETNEWIGNDDHYRLPDAFTDQADLPGRLDELDGADGDEDGAWRDVPLDDPARWEELPAFADHHADRLVAMMADEGYGDDAITDLLFTNFKQIDLLGHYFNMASIQVRDALRAGDAALATIVEYLDAAVGRGRYVVIVTADHGQQPDAAAVGGFGIDPNELEADIEQRFGPVVEDVAPTEVFLDRGAIATMGPAVDDIARFLGDYRLSDNASSTGQELFGSGRFSPADRLFEMAVPAQMLTDTDCAR